MCDECSGMYGCCDCVTCKRCGVEFQREPGEFTDFCLGCLTPIEYSRRPGWLTRVELNSDGSREVIESFKGQEVERYRRL